MYNEPIEWKPETVISAKPYYMDIFNEKGKRTSVTYEDTRLRPRLRLTQELAKAQKNIFLRSV